MSDSSRFAGRVGLASDFFEPDKIAHLAIEAPIERVAAAVENASRFFSLPGSGTLSIERDVFGKPSGNVWPLATMFQLQGQSWTQLAADIRNIRGLPLARWLSRELEARCICIEVTDDAYQSHALFDMGVTEEVYLLSMNVDMKRSLIQLGVEVPAEFEELDPDDFDELDEAEYTYRRDGPPSSDTAELVARVGCFLCTSTFGEAVHCVSDLRSGDLVRMDVIRRGEDRVVKSLDSP